MYNRKTLNTILAGAVALTAASFASQSAHAMDAKPDQEKCYGIAKAGKNDCSSADGAHNCAAAATIDASGVEWIGTPKGLCERIVGGSLEPITTTITKTDAPVEGTAQ